jgi:integrase
VVDELLSERKREGKSERYLRSLRSHLNRFKESFRTDIGSVMTAPMEAWLSHIGGGARTRNNLRCSLVTLFHFARKRGYLARGVTTEADEIGRNDVQASEANIYTPAELEKLLHTADPRVLPFVAIGAFCGLRSASIVRLRWENVKWEQGFIEIPAAIAKNKKRYLVPLLPCLAAWLAPYRGQKGNVIARVRIEDRLRDLFQEVGVERRHNGLRDSFISYRVAQTQNIPQVACEAGNSVEMIKSKYLEARTRAEADAWFAVMPATAENVVSIGREA